MLALFGAITAGIYATERSAAIGAVAASARVAAGGVDAPSGLGDDAPSRAQVLHSARVRAISLVAPSAFGDRVVEVQGDCGNDQPGPGVVEVCAFESGAPDALVTVMVNGRAGLPLPRFFGFLAGFPIQVHASMHRLTFAR